MGRSSIVMDSSLRPPREFLKPNFQTTKFGEMYDKYFKMEKKLLVINKSLVKCYGTSSR